MQAYYLKLRKEPPPHGTYNPLQKAAYTTVLLRHRAARRAHGPRALAGDRRDRQSADVAARRAAVRAAVAFRRNDGAVSASLRSTSSRSRPGRRQSDALDDHRLVSTGEREAADLYRLGVSSALAGCGRSAPRLNNNTALQRVLESAEGLNHALIGTRGMAREYTRARHRPDFRVNGFATPTDARYIALVARRLSPLPADRRRRGRTTARASPSRSSRRCRSVRRSRATTASKAGARSASGAASRSATVLDLVQPRAGARYVVFRCLDNDGAGKQYYESLDLHQARHPQALLALASTARRSIPTTARPCACAVPTQLGYKSAKWVARIEIVGSFANITRAAAATGKTGLRMVRRHLARSLRSRARAPVR